MMKQRTVGLFTAVVGIVLLIFDGRTAMDGIREGIDLCIQTLIPSLFPFFVLSGVITGALTGRWIPCMRRLCRFCHMGTGSESFLAVGILGGFPVGAGNISDAQTKGYLTVTEANRMAVFCNNAGPSFIFGVLGAFFPNKSWLFALWLIQVSSSVLTGHLLGGDQLNIPVKDAQTTGFAESVSRGMRNMAAVCGWVILFRMTIVFLDRWVLWMVPPAVSVLLAGILELSNGCLGLDTIESLSVRFAVASFMLSAGGLCVLMQTKAVFPELNRHQYLTGKAVYTLISLVLSVAAITVLQKPTSLAVIFPAFLAVTASVHLHFRRKSKKAVAIP